MSGASAITREEALARLEDVGPGREVVYRELPEGSQHVCLWEMTEAQRELTALSCYLRPYGIEIRFVNDEIPDRGLRVLKRVNGLISLMDEHAVESAFSTNDSPSLSETER